MGADLATTPEERAVDVPSGPMVAGRYVLLDRLGQGGAGAVFAAYDSELHRRVALKFVRGRAVEGDSGSWRARLLREAKAMARLSHTNVVTLYDVCVSSQGEVFLAMELVEGGTLTRWLRERPRGWREIVAMLCDAGEGLAAAHRAGMIHRDFKPDNVLLGADGRLRVTDFGLARSAEAPTNDVSPTQAPTGPSPLAATSLAQLTLTGSVMGTPGYMAPEQYTSPGSVDARADVFAFCATLYRALYGVKPFEGDTFEQVARSTLLGQVRRPPKGSRVPAWVGRVVTSGLATRREVRPASMDELLRVLRKEPARLRWLVAGVAAVAIGALALGTWARSAHPASVAAAISADTVPEAPKVDPPAATSAAVEADGRDVGPGTDPAAASTPTASAPPKKAGKLAGAPRLAIVGGPVTKASAAPHATPSCAVETTYDAEGSPHFKKVCK